MISSWTTDLKNLLCGYFSEYNISISADDLALVTEGLLDYQNRYLATLDAGITAASAGNTEVVEIIVDCMGHRPNGPAEAKAILEDVRRAYVTALSRRDLVVNDGVRGPSSDR
jgi:hypothetical protein